MNKRANLAAALQTATRGGEANLPPSAATVTALRATAPSRLGKKTVAAHFDPAVSRQLKQLGLDRDTSTQALLREALNDLFTKYGKPPIA
jgi:uroporphyrinogen-III synthase